MSLIQFIDMRLSQAPVILAAATIFALLSWWIIPENKWLSREHTAKMLEETELVADDDASVKKDVAVHETSGQVA